VETKDICKRIVQLRRKPRPLVLETKDHLADLVVMDLVDLEEMHLVEVDSVATDETDLVAATEEMDRTEVETIQTQ